MDRRPDSDRSTIHTDYGTIRNLKRIPVPVEYSHLWRQASVDHVGIVKMR